MARASEAAAPGRPEPSIVRDASVLVVINSTADRYARDEVRARIDTALHELGKSVRRFEVPTTQDARERVVHEVKRALADGCERVVAVGGDGTVSMVADGLARADDGVGSAALGIIPAGTANILARELGIPGALEEAVAIATGSEHTLKLDAIRMGGRHFLTQIGVGPDARMIRKTSRDQQKKLGRVAYMINFAREGLRHRSRRFEIHMNGSRVQARAWEIVVANVGTLGAPPFTWGPKIDPTDGQLDICVYDAQGLLDYLHLVWLVILKRHRAGRSMRFFRVKGEASIRSDRPVLIQADGEVLGTTPVAFQVAPGAVRVFIRPQAEVPEKAPPAEARAEVVATGKAPEAEPIAEEVKTMLATEHSRTWVLQGWARHPIAALQALDAAIYLRVNALSLGGLADRMAYLISSTMRYGEGWALVLAAMIAVDFRTGLRAAVEAVPVIGLTMLTVNYPLKRLFQRRRPFISYVKARVVGVRPRDFSFPSGHAAAGFAGALVLSAHAPALSPLFYLLAVVVSLSRVYLGVHYPSDVAFGAFLGAMIASIYRALLYGLVPWLR